MEDCRSECFKRFVWFWTRRAMRRRFYNVVAWNAEVLESAVRESPVILFSNHASWWDAFVDHMVERVFRLNHFSLVDDRTLETQGWLKKIGAMPIDLTSTRGAVAGLRAAREFLQSAAVNGRFPTLILYPQGKIVPTWKRPFGFQGGLAWLKKNVPRAQLIPLSRRYEFLNEEKPQILLQFGPAFAVAPVDAGEDILTARLEECLDQSMVALERKIESCDLNGARVILRGGWSLNKKWEWLKRCLTGKTRGFSPLN